MSTLKFIFKIIPGLEELTSQEILEKLNVKKLILSPYGNRGWVKCEIESNSFKNISNLRSIIEAYMILLEEDYTKEFSIDRFADAIIKEIPSYAPLAKRISVSAYSSHKKLNQREIQGAISRRITEKLNLECNLKNYDTALRVTLLEKVALATINLEIQPGNISKKLETHPTPLLPPIAYFMIKLAYPQTGEHLLDPMCGCGTIPCMAALEWKNIKITGSDISSDYISCAKRNAVILGIANKIKFNVRNIAEITNKGVQADIIAFNPPYGISIPLQNGIEILYDKIFNAASKMLLENGRIVIITPYPDLVEKVIQKKKVNILESYKIYEEELARTIQLIKKL